MSRSAAKFWKRARENLVNFPECPLDMSEPAYANLMFSPHCHVSAHFCFLTVVTHGMVVCLSSAFMPES